MLQPILDKGFEALFAIIVVCGVGCAAESCKAMRSLVSSSVYLDPPLNRIPWRARRCCWHLHRGRKSRKRRLARIASRAGARSRPSVAERQDCGAEAYDSRLVATGGWRWENGVIPVQEGEDESENRNAGRAGGRDAVCDPFDDAGGTACDDPGGRGRDACDAACDDAGDSRGDAACCQQFGSIGQFRNIK